MQANLIVLRRKPDRALNFAILSLAAVALAAAIAMAVLGLEQELIIFFTWAFLYFCWDYRGRVCQDAREVTINPQNRTLAVSELRTFGGVRTERYAVEEFATCTSYFPPGPAGSVVWVELFTSRPKRGLLMCSFSGCKNDEEPSEARQLRTLLVSELQVEDGGFHNGMFKPRRLRRSRTCSEA